MASLRDDEMTEAQRKFFRPRTKEEWIARVMFHVKRGSDIEQWLSILWDEAQKATERG